jgi:hypothetical protein
MAEGWPADQNRLAERLEQTVKDRMVRASDDAPG